MSKSEWAKTTELINAAIAVLQAENPATIRQLFYRLVSVGEIENCLHDYQRLSKAMTKARNDARVPFSWITDRSRPRYAGEGWDDLMQYAECSFANYHRDNWQEQHSYVECWVEKDAIVGSIEKIADDWGIWLRALRGFNSTTSAHAIATDFKNKNTLGKQIRVLYLGDHDASGRSIEVDVADRVRTYGSGPFKIERLAIHKSDIAKFHLPPLRVKEADPRAGEFIRRFGTQTVELDALPPSELRRRLETAIRALVDMERWNRALMIEQAELQTTARIHAILSHAVRKELNR